MKEKKKILKKSVKSTSAFDKTFTTSTTKKLFPCYRTIVFIKFVKVVKTCFPII